MATTAVAVKPSRGVRPRPRKILRTGGVALVVVGAAGYFGISAYVADKLTHPARHLPEGTPQDYELNYETVTFKSAQDNIELSGWYIDSAGDKTIVMMHGRDFSRTANGGLEKAAVLAGFGYNVLMFDFRGHGLSGGERFAFGEWETRDLEGALQYLKDIKGVTEVGVYGISMGAAAALLAAANHPEIQAVMEESSFAEFKSVAEDLLPANSGLPRLFNPGILLLTRLLYCVDVSVPRPVDAVQSMGDRPILLVHSEADEFIPIDHAYKLQAAGAGNPNLSLWTVRDAAHCEAFSTHKAEYAEHMRDFFSTYLK